MLVGRGGGGSGVAGLIESVSQDQVVSTKGQEQSLDLPQAALPMYHIYVAPGGEQAGT